MKQVFDEIREKLNEIKVGMTYDADVIWNVAVAECISKIDEAEAKWNTRADADIRAKAIDEFAERISMYGTYDYHGNVINVLEIAEQMKGGMNND